MNNIVVTQFPDRLVITNGNMSYDLGETRHGSIVVSMFEDLGYIVTYKDKTNITQTVDNIKLSDGVSLVMQKALKHAQHELQNYKNEDLIDTLRTNGFIEN